MNRVLILGLSTMAFGTILLLARAFMVSFEAGVLATGIAGFSIGLIITHIAVCELSVRGGDE